MHRKLYIPILLSFLLIISFFSCTQPTKPPQKNKKTVPKVKQIDTDLYRQIINLINDLPAQNEIFTLINKYNIKFDPKLLNPIYNYNTYETQYSKAINLGVYISDMFYSATFDQDEYKMNYMGLIRKIATDLNLDQNINDSLQKELENNISNPDSLLLIIKSTYRQIVYSMERNKQLDLAVLSLGGFWIETFYISTHLLKKYPEVPETTALIQKYINILKKLLGIFQNYKDISSTHLTFYTELKELAALYDESEQPLNYVDFNKLFIRCENIRNSYTKN